MKITIQVMIGDDTTPQAVTAKVVSMEHNVEDLRPETLGLKGELDDEQSSLVVVRFSEIRADSDRMSQ